MAEQHYQIHLSTQLGPRHGTLDWTEQDGRLNGSLQLLGQTHPFSGQVLRSGQYSFAGQIETLVSHIPYQAECVLTGSGLTGTFRTASGDYAIVGEKLGPGNPSSEETV